MPRNPADAKAPRQTMLKQRDPLPPEMQNVAPEDPPPASPGLQTHVLLISEENDDAAVCRYLLEREGLKVLRAKNQREGLKIARREQPELVIMDATLPDGRGQELALELRLQPKLAGCL